MLTYICQPNPSGKGEFMVMAATPINRGDRLTYNGKEYAVLLVKHLIPDGKTHVRQLVLGSV